MSSCTSWSDAQLNSAGGQRHVLTLKEKDLAASEHLCNQIKQCSKSSDLSVHLVSQMALAGSFMMEVGSWWAVTTACSPEVIIALVFLLTLSLSTCTSIAKSSHSGHIAWCAECVGRGAHLHLRCAQHYCCTNKYQWGDGHKQAALLEKASLKLKGSELLLNCSAEFLSYNFKADYKIQFAEFT